MRRLLQGLTGLLVLFLALAAYLFWDHYWRWRDCFDSEGRCFDHQVAVVYHEQSGVALGGVILLVLLLLAVALRVLRRCS